MYVCVCVILSKEKLKDIYLEHNKKFIAIGGRSIMYRLSPQSKAK